MHPWLRAQMVLSCWELVGRILGTSKDDVSDDDDPDDSSLHSPLFWSRDLEKHRYGEFSFAVIKGNEVIEDHSQVETGREATFVGVYDGHGGPDASRYISRRLFRNFIRIAKEKGTISENILRSAVIETEDGFLSFGRGSFVRKPSIAAVGSCCLVGIIWRGSLYVANLGDSRAVIGSLGESKKVVAEQLTRDHNVGLEEIRSEVRALHPDDPDIVVENQEVWRIKGIIQASRTIGDAYMKEPEYNADPRFRRYYLPLPEPFQRPLLTPEPSLHRRVLQPNDGFVIFASDGLWENLTNQQAVDIVNKHQRAGIARKLIKRALKEAAKKRQMNFDELLRVPDATRRNFHDDITVVVIFVDHDLLEKGASVPELSVRGFGEVKVCHPM
ncbi:hypothetical protein SLE2022_063420 [Rubroshorea leprosula]